MEVYNYKKEMMKIAEKEIERIGWMRKREFEAMKNDPLITI